MLRNKSNQIFVVFSKIKLIKQSMELVGSMMSTLSPRINCRSLCVIVSLAKAYATQIISLNNPLGSGMVFPPTHHHKTRN